MEWQDISSAPKDGQAVLLYLEWEKNKYERNIAFFPNVTEAYYNTFLDKWVIPIQEAYNSGEGYEGYDQMELDPTHWMPLSLSEIASFLGGFN